jgi:hypothetical protein
MFYTFCTHSSFGCLCAVTSSTQAAFSSHTAVSGTQQYTEEFPFAFKDENDIDASSIQHYGMEALCNCALLFVHGATNSFAKII